MTRDQIIEQLEDAREAISIALDGLTGEAALQLPPYYATALGEKGVKEFAGEADNPRIVEYLRTTRLPEGMASEDETAWCSAFVNWCMERAGLEGTKSAAARSWITWGEGIDDPTPGCVVVLWRKTLTSPFGHVGFFVRKDGDQLYLLGGNQKNSVSIQPYPEHRLLAYRTAA